MATKEDEFAAKQEGNISEIKISKPASTVSASWTRLKDPRIVRVSRAFGGKDRHSKVCTVRGLRDRRVRLSVQTAIQLYDLQDRLGLNQPSKVVEWLLKAAKHGIDELPPLQLPPGNFPQNLYPMASAKALIKTNSSINWDDPSVQSTLNAIDSVETQGDKSKEITEETNDDDKDQNWARNGEEKGSNLEDHGPYLASNSNHFFPSSLMPYSSFQRWDHSNLSLSHDGGSHGLTSQAEEFHNFNVALGTQVVSYPPGLMQSYFINSQILSSSPQNSMSRSLTQPVEDSNQSVRPFHFSMMTNKDNDFHSR